MEVITPHGLVRMPTYMPVTTFGGTYPLDDVIRPYLPRVADCLMVSFHYARQMAVRPSLPLFVDSGGFAALLPGASIEQQADGTGAIRLHTEGEDDLLTPQMVLAYQEGVADFGATLDFPIPPKCDPAEAARRQQLTVANAIWALQHRQAPTMRLFGCVQGWDCESYVACAKQMLDAGFTDLAIGGLVPRLHDRPLVLGIVAAIAALGPQLLHAFGVGSPEMSRLVVEAGATSVDSSSYVQSSLNGHCWDGSRIDDPSVFERVRLALRNLEIAQFGRTRPVLGA